MTETIRARQRLFRKPPASPEAMEGFLASYSRLTATAALRLIILAVLTWGGFRLIELGRRLFDKRVVQKADDPSRRARLATLLDAGVKTAQLFLLIAVGLMVLGALGFDIGPILAAAGVAGLAISLGAQAIIKDFIGGLLILLEDQFRVGDVIRVQETEGTVERISLRACTVRDIQGRLWVVPNGEIRFVSNATRDWSRAVVDLNLELTADVNQAVAVLQAAATQAAQEPAFQEILLEAPVVEGFTAINDWAVQVRVKAMTQAGQQWTASRILRERSLAALRQAGIPLASRLPTRDELAQAG